MPHSPLAISGSEQIKLAPLSLSMEKCREAPRKHSRIWKYNDIERLNEDYGVLRDIPLYSVKMYHCDCFIKELNGQ